MTIPLKGNTGTAMKDDILYANEYRKLLAIRVDENGYEVVKTVQDAPYPYDVPFIDVVDEGVPRPARLPEYCRSECR